MAPRLIFADLRGPEPRLMEPPARSVLCLGNFDGVHRAHAVLLNEGKQLTRELTASEGKTLSGVFCFIRPTVDYVFTPEGVTPVRVRGHLTTLRDKLRLFARMRMDFVCLCNFPDVRDYSPAEFITLLKESCGCVGAVCGFNHYFGRHASGTVYHLLEAFGKDRVRIQPEMKMDGLTVSSSRIRQCLKQGDVETAERLLGRPYSLETAVVHGKALGRTLGFPTANQYFPAERAIPHGWAQKEKLGFPVPVVSWLREERYFNQVKRAFESEEAARFFDVAELLRMLDEHRKGADRSRRIWIVYSFLIWYRVFFVDRAKPCGQEGGL